MSGFATTLPVYMRLAAETDDPVERMKLTMAANFSWFMKNHCWEKPLNPILGETFTATGQDGTRLYMEQTAHHPPRSHLWVEGPDELYTMSGYLEYEIYSGVRSTSVNCHGHKQVNFKDGTKIKWNQNNDTISGIMLGTMLH